MWPHLLRIFLLSWGTDCSGGGWTGATVWQEILWVSPDPSVLCLGESLPESVVILKDPSRVVFHCFDCASVLIKRVRPFYSRPGKKSCCITVPATPCWRVDRTDLGDFWRYSCNERSWQDAAPTTLVRQVSPQNFDEVLRRAARDGSSIGVYL